MLTSLSYIVKKKSNKSMREKEILMRGKRTSDACISFTLEQKFKII